VSEPLPAFASHGDVVSYREHEEALIQLSASEREVRRLRSALMRLEREQSVTEDSPEAKEVKELLELWWREVKNSDPRVAYELESTRATKVRSTLKRRRMIARKKKLEDPDEAGFDICRRAILGVLHDDWAMGRIKKSGGKSFNCIAEHILNTDGDIEKFAKLYDDHQQAASEPAPSKPALRLVEALPYDPLEVVHDSANRLGLEPRGEVWRFRACCPAHEDSDRSLLVVEGHDRRAELYCAAGCSPEEVAKGLGVSWGALFPEGHKQHHLIGQRRAA
jgi:hypothetical protein